MFVVVAAGSALAVVVRLLHSDVVFLVMAAVNVVVVDSKVEQQQQLGFATHRLSRALRSTLQQVFRELCWFLEILFIYLFILRTVF